MRSVAHASDLERPASPPVERSSDLPAHLAKDLVTRLGRAVQRATIYPAGHPSIRLATTPLVESLHELDLPEVLVGFTSERVFAGIHHRDAHPFELPWLSSRLSARGLSSVRLSSRLALEEAERLVAWLAGSDDLLDLDTLPVFEGATVARVDFAAVRFRERRPDEPAVGSPEDLAWRAAALELAGDWAPPGFGASQIDPTELAALVRDAIERFEGTGVAELSDRLTSTGASVATLSGELQTVVKARLGLFVAALPAGLRGQLLAASAADDPTRLSMLTDLVEHLPSAVVLEAIEGVELTHGSDSRQFVSFMLRLAGLAADDPRLVEAYEGRCAAAGLSRDVAHLETPELRRVLEDLLRSRPGDAPGITPEPYEQRLNELGATRLAVRAPCDCSAHAPPGDAAVLARQTARIALLLVAGAAGDATDREPCVDRLAAALAPAQAAWDVELLAGIAHAALRLATEAGLPESLAKKAAELAAWFERPSMVEPVLARLEAADHEPAAELIVLARAGGVTLAETVLVRLVQTPDQGARRRLSRVLAWLDPVTVRAGLSDLLRKAPRGARALLAALVGSGAAGPAAEAARLCLADDDPALRLDALRALLAFETNPTRWEAIARRGLEDSDPRVLHLAVDEAARRPRPGVRLLIDFLDHRTSPAAVSAQHHAILVLAAAGGREAREGLRALLVAHRTRFDAASRDVAAAIAAALVVEGGPDDVAAARAWRRSPAGWVAWLVGAGRAA